MSENAGAVSIYDSLKTLGANVAYVKVDDLKGVVATDYDVIIAAIGERPYTEMMGDIVTGAYPYPDRKPYGYTLNYYDLHPEDKEVIFKSKSLGLPIGVVMYSGRKLDDKSLQEDVDALIYVGFLEVKLLVSQKNYSEIFSFRVSD